MRKIIEAFRSVSAFSRLKIMLKCIKIDIESMRRADYGKLQTYAS